VNWLLGERISGDDLIRAVPKGTLDFEELSASQKRSRHANHERPKASGAISLVFDGKTKLFDHGIG
jgi:hypothetical protein